MNPSFSIGSFEIFYYGLVLGIAILVGYFFARWRTNFYEVPKTVFDTVFILVVPLAIIGARLYFVAFNLGEYIASPERIFALREGGLAIHGALLGGLLGLLVTAYIYRKKPTYFSWSGILDVLAPVMLLSQAIGRFANFVNQEAFGSPTSLPWGIPIDVQNRPEQFSEASHFHPTFAYEAIWNLIGLALLIFIERRWRKQSRKLPGALFALYVLWYSFGRFWIEFLRTDALLLGHVRIAQVASVLGVLGSLIYLWYRYKQWKTAR